MNIPFTLTPKNLLYFGVALLLTLAALFGVSTIAGAQEARESITLSPVKKNYTVKPGQTVTDSLTVLNDGATSYTFTVYATPYSVQNGNYNPNFTTDTPNADVYKWVQFDKTSYEIAPRETLTIPFTLQVKEDATPGGHYGAIFVEIQPDEDTQNSGVVVHKRVSTLLFATVDGPTDFAGQTTGISIPWYQSHPPLRATASVENTGNTDFPAKVTLTVQNVFGATKYTNTQDYSVLPNTTRDIAISWEQSNWFGLYKASVTTEVLGEIDTSESYVLVVPTWLVLLLILCSIAGGVYAFITQQKKRAPTPDDTSKTKSDNK